MNFETSKILGCVGALLIFLSIFTFTSTFGFMILIGSIFVLISIYGLAKFYKDKEIFNNALYGTLTTIIGVTTAFAFTVASPLWTTLKDNIYRYVPDWNGNWTNLSGISAKLGIIFRETLRQCGPLIVIVLIVLWLFLIIAMIFMRMSMKKLAQHSHNNTFADTGNMLIVSAAIPLIGLLGIWLSTVLLAWTFLTIKKLNPPQISQSTSSFTETCSYCTYCGASTTSKSLFCVKCGKQLQTNKTQQT